MNQFRRLSVVEQAENSIKSMIGSGELQGPLPPVRSLANRLGLSVPTLLKVLQRLVKSGFLSKAGRTAAYTASQTPAKGIARRPFLLFVADAAEDELNLGDRRMLDLLGERCVRKNIDFHTERLAFGTCEAPKPSWSRHLLRHNPTHILVLRGNAAMKAWCESTGLITNFLGARDLTTAPHFLSIKLGWLIARVLSEFKTKGHRKVLMPLKIRDKSVGQWLSERVANGLQVPLETVVKEQWVLPWPGAAASRRQEALMAGLESTGATGIFVGSWDDYLLVQSALGKAGRRIPEDVSLACMTHAEDMRHLVPAPAHFGLRPDDFVEAIMRWVEGGAVEPMELTERALATWEPGESLAAPRTGAGRKSADKTK